MTTKKMSTFWGVFYMMAIVLAPMTPGHASTQGPIKIVIHVTQAKNNAYRAAITYIKHIQKAYGEKGYIIEVVANGPGIGLVNSQNLFEKQVLALQKQGIKFTACSTTIDKLKKLNRPVPLVKGVEVTPAGIIRVLRLQQQGYYYIQP